MHPTLEDLEKALEVLREADDLGHDPGGPMSLREALDIVFMASPKQLHQMGFSYVEPLEGKEEE